MVRSIANRKSLSAWRYLSQLGPTLILVCFAAVAAFIGKKPALTSMRSRHHAMKASAALACIVPACLVVITRNHWQIDLEYPNVRALHEIATALKPMISGEPLSVVHPIDALGFAVQIDYDLRRPAGASSPFLSIDQAPRTDTALDLNGIELAHCPRLIRWTEKGWSEVSSSSLLGACTN